MNRAIFIAPALALAAPAPAQAQGVIPDVISSTVANMNRGLPERCLDGRMEPDAAESARFTAEAEPALRAYLALAAAGSDPTPAFTSRRNERSWALDAEPLDLATGRDPWAARIARLELVGLRLGGWKVHGRGLWRAFAADGTELGLYDGYFRAHREGFRVSALDLFSPGGDKQPTPIAGFCDVPGDTEQFREARAAREEHRAARRAEREAARTERAAGR